MRNVAAVTAFCALGLLGCEQQETVQSRQQTPAPVSASSRASSLEAVGLELFRVEDGWVTPSGGHPGEFLQRQDSRLLGPLSTLRLRLATEQVTSLSGGRSIVHTEVIAAKASSAPHAFASGMAPSDFDIEFFVLVYRTVPSASGPPLRSFTAAGKQENGGRFSRGVASEWESVSVSALVYTVSAASHSERKVGAETWTVYGAEGWNVVDSRTVGEINALPFQQSWFDRSLYESLEPE